MQADAVVSRWSVVMEGHRAPVGTMELHRAPGGLYWAWPDRPADLVPIVGVRDPFTPEDKKPIGFTTVDHAMFHVMDCIGFAFRGRCNLVQVATPAASVAQTATVH